MSRNELIELLNDMSVEEYNQMSKGELSDLYINLFHVRPNKAFTKQYLITTLRFTAQRLIHK